MSCVRMHCKDIIDADNALLHVTLARVRMLTVQLAWETLLKLQNVTLIMIAYWLQHRNVVLQNGKMNILRSIMMSVLLHSGETWTLRLVQQAP